MNDLELDKIRIDLSPQKIEELIKDYYLCLDPSIEHIKVTWHLSREDEFGDDVWRGYNYYMNIETQREIYALGEVQKVKNNLTLKEIDLEKVFKEILKKDKLVFDFIHPPIFDNTTTIECHKLTRKRKFNTN